VSSGPKPPRQSRTRSSAKQADVQVIPATTPRTQATDPATNSAPTLQVTAISASAYPTPIPPPEVLERYEAIQPGFSNRLLSLVETQSAHRQDLERINLIGEGRRAWAGLFSALFISTLTIGGAIFLGATQHTWGADALAAALGTSGIGGLAGTFIYGSKARKDERLERTRLLSGHGPSSKRSTHASNDG